MRLVCSRGHEFDTRTHHKGVYYEDGDRCPIKLRDGRRCRRILHEQTPDVETSDAVAQLRDAAQNVRTLIDELRTIGGVTIGPKR